jgi:DNA (cytosine-5)-methyltransferase 1
LGAGFEDNGFCVVRGGDKITGGDIANFKPPAGAFAGVFGGPPCQDFSALNRHPGTYGHEMLNEYCRVVSESRPDWFLFENVARAPSFTILGYTQQRFALDLAWFNGYSRLRHFVFGSLSGVLLNPMISVTNKTNGGAVVGNDSRSFRACCDIQGLPADFDLPDFNAQAKKQAVANGVPLPMARYLASMIKRDYYGIGNAEIEGLVHRRCKCGCGRIVVGRSLYAGAACRKRAQRQRSANAVTTA